MDKQKKRILIFSTTYNPFIGGAEVAIKEETERIDDIEFDMVTLRFDSNLPKFEKIGKINVYRIGFSRRGTTLSDLVSSPLKLNKILFPFLAWWKARGLHKDNPYNGIWAMMASYAGFSAMFFKVNYPEVPYLLTLQEGDPIDYIKKKVKPVYFLFRKIFTKADLIQVISVYLSDWARDMEFKGQLEIIPNAVNTKHFSQEYTYSESEELKGNLEKKDGDIFIITTSRLVLKNAVDDVIKSLKYLPENYKFIILGDGPDRQDLENLTEKEGVRDRVKFLGSIEHNKIPKYLKASDVFVRPSLSEGFGNSFIEAMASEIPVIATPVGGIVDFLKDEETGVFCEVRNPKVIAEKIKLISENEILRNKIVKNAKKMVFEKYDWDIIAKDMQQKVFNNLLGHPMSK